MFAIKSLGLDYGYKAYQELILQISLKEGSNALFHRNASTKCY